MTDDLTPNVSRAGSDPGPIREPAGPGLGHLVSGALLILVGVGWLIETADWGDVPWRILLAVSLIVVGLALMWGSRTGSHGGLIALGVVLTIVVALGTALEVLADIPLTGGVGEEIHRPLSSVDDEYRWALGSMTLDLSGATALEGETIEASVAIGELVVIVPDDVAVQVDARSGIGEVEVLDRRSSGLGADLTFDEGGEMLLVLDLDVAIGRVEVRR
jgi:predicted membrane protein